MPSLVVVGTQWGDEGKGKVVDLLTEFADVVVRYQGGDNAGHTVIVGDDRIVLHLLPSGVLRPTCRCLLGQGMVVRPGKLLEEIDALAARGMPLDASRLLVSARAHVVLPLHLAADEAEERRRGERGIGTTRRGIGPCYEDKAARRGVRIADLGDPLRLRALVEDVTACRAPLLERQGVAVPDPAETCRALEAAWARLAPFVGDASHAVHEALERGRHVLFEGAQGTLLDLDQGTYPFVTSSTTVAAGACAGAGVPPAAIDGVLGVCKAYTTRVGNGPFPTEADDETARKLREAGGEFGATTGRPRRCGWFDAAAVRRAVRVNGLASLALTKLDVLQVLGPEIQVCVGYEVDGAVEPEIPLDRLDRARPVYETVKGIPEPLRDVRSPDDLPASARRYLALVEKWVGVPVSLLSVGARRAETLVFDNPFRFRRRGASGRHAAVARGARSGGRG